MAAILVIDQEKTAFRGDDCRLLGDWSEASDVLGVLSAFFTPNNYGLHRGKLLLLNHLSRNVISFDFFSF